MPIDRRPIRRGWVDVVDGVVVGVGSPQDDPAHGAPPRPEIDLGDAIVMPGLVNAHTHLELSGLRDQVPPSPTMPAWAEQVMTLAAGERPEAGAITRAIDEAVRTGTTLVGDVSNTLASVAPLQAARLPAVVFREVLGFDEQTPQAWVSALGRDCRDGSTGDLRLRLAAHAPYSVSPALFAALRDTAGAHRLWPLSVHAAESSEELEFLRSGTGAWRQILEQRRRWDPAWRPSGAGVVGYLDELGWLDAHIVLVHGVQLTDSELAQAAEAGATLVTCPRSNRWTGAGVPPVEAFYRSGIRVAIGTDSLASADDLNLFSELRELRRCAPSVPASALLHSATAAGADALGFGPEIGRIAPGARARLITVQGAGRVDDVEEYLVSGIQPDQIEWLSDRTG